jgi:hypothetical protein
VSVLGAPALALLLRLKLRGTLRRQARRLKTPKGILLTLLGFAAFATWFGSLAFSFLQEPRTLAADQAEGRVRAFALLFTVLSLTSALSNRGLFLPKNEIERLFAAPLARADLVRYRLLAGALRSLIGGVAFGLFAARRMPSPPLAFLGIVVSMQTLPVLNQALALALSGLEARAANGLRRAGSLFLLLLVVALGASAVWLASGREPSAMPVLGELLAGVMDSSGDPFGHPLLAAVTSIFTPWARLIAAGSLAGFVPWFLVVVLLHLAFFELTARLAGDFRESSLATATRVAARSARMRRGGGVAATRASGASARWRIPWLFGRGPLGALAWRKCAGLARKAKGAFWLALIALLFITLIAHLVLDGSRRDEAAGTPVMIALLGTIYLCSGLRFDFREELERMDVIRSWPLAPWRIFLGTLLPEVVLVSLLVGVTVVLQAAFAATLGVQVVGVVLCLPFLVFTWAALDNVVFLFAPVRIVPGQDGFVQNAGRRMLQMALLGTVVAVMAGLGFLAFSGAYALVIGPLHGSARAALVAGFAGVLVELCVCASVLVGVGGAVLRRFDVARDRA